jgi:predicted adenylyl cyclase CyaB
MAEKRLVELKARCADLEAVRQCLSPVARLETVLVQRDTYFTVPRGRLKLREVSDRPAQLILYDRPDVAGVKGSRIHLAEVPDGAALRTLLEVAFGVRVRVAKRREIWRWDGVQVHLDTVEGLGTFVEFELAVEDDAASARGEKRLHDLLAQLGLGRDALLAGSYADLV